MTASLDSRIAAPATRIHHATGPRAETVGAFLLDTPLQRALVGMLHDGQVPMCAYDPDLWTSETRADRAAAVAACVGCPLLAECRAEADERGETWGVWGGRDYTKTLRALSRKTATRTRPSEPQTPTAPPKTPRVKRPGSAPTADVILRELEDAATVGLSLEEAAARLGYTNPKSLERRIRRLGILDQVRAVSPYAGASRVEVAAVETERKCRKCGRRMHQYQTPPKRYECRSCRYLCAHQRRSAA